VTLPLWLLIAIYTLTVGLVAFYGALCNDEDETPSTFQLVMGVVRRYTCDLCRCDSDRIVIAIVFDSDYLGKHPWLK